MGIKSVIQLLVGDSVVGMIDYYRFPAQRAAWGGPFNGQQRRQELFAALMQKFKPGAIIETGTYLGTTTEFMAGTGIPVYSVEGNARHYGFARARLWRERRVRLQRGDSRKALHSLFDSPLRACNGHTVFAYLDAHWNDDLPLADELEIIFTNCQTAVVMVDDFQVTDDPGYGYDDYGPGKALNAGYIAALVEAYDLAIFYPSASSQEETGLRRGCAVLCKAAVLGSELEAIPLLRRGFDHASASSRLEYSFGQRTLE